MLLKCCNQYASKLGKLRTWKAVSIQSQRRAMPKNLQTIVLLCSLHMLAKLCSKSSRLDFSSMWTENFQMYKLGLEKAEEPEVKLPTHVIIEKAREFQKNIYICFTDSAKALHCVDHKKLRKLLKGMWIQDHFTYHLRSLYAHQEATVRTEHGTTDSFKLRRGVCQSCILSLNLT